MWWLAALCQASSGLLCHKCEKESSLSVKTGFENVIILNAVKERELGLGVYTDPYAGDSDTSVILDY